MKSEFQVGEIVKWNVHERNSSWFNHLVKIVEIYSNNTLDYEYVTSPDNNIRAGEKSFMGHVSPSNFIKLMNCPK